MDAIYRAGSDAVAAMLAAQAERITALEAELEELKRLIGGNSNSSSLPPLRDSRKVREQRSKQRSSGKKQGGQPGHKGRQRKLVANPDHTGQRCTGDAATRSPRALCTSVPRHGSSSAGGIDLAPERDRNRTQAATPPASGDTRANTNAGVGPAITRYVLVANGRAARIASREPIRCKRWAERSSHSQKGETAPCGATQQRSHAAATAGRDCFFGWR